MIFLIYVERLNAVSPFDPSVMHMTSSMTSQMCCGLNTKPRYTNFCMKSLKYLTNNL